MFRPGPSYMSEEELSAYLEGLPPLTPFPDSESRLAAIKGIHFNPFEIPSDDMAWMKDTHEEHIRIKLAIIEYAEAWGRLVEEALQSGEDFNGAIERCATLANCHDIRPELFFAAMNYLASLWVLGPDLVSWWIGQG